MTTKTTSTWFKPHATTAAKVSSTASINTAPEFNKNCLGKDSTTSLHAQAWACHASTIVSKGNNPIRIRDPTFFFISAAALAAKVLSESSFSFGFVS